MFTLKAFATAKIGLGEASIVALLGYCVVFVGLVLLMLVVTALVKVMVYRQKQEAAPLQASIPEAQPIPQITPKEAKGTGGQILLHDVPEREAALVMAVVAHQLGKPLNQLRFQSIREVKDK